MSDTPQPQHTVDEVMRRWPATTRVFLRRRMACVGCPVGPFHTLAEAAVEYRIPLQAFLSELRRAAIPSGDPLRSRPRAAERDHTMDAEDARAEL